MHAISFFSICHVSSLDTARRVSDLGSTGGSPSTTPEESPQPIGFFPTAVPLAPSTTTVVPLAHPSTTTGTPKPSTTPQHAAKPPSSVKPTTESDEEDEEEDLFKEYEVDVDDSEDDAEEDFSEFFLPTCGSNRPNVPDNLPTFTDEELAKLGDNTSTDHLPDSVKTAMFKFEQDWMDFHRRTKINPDDYPPDGMRMPIIDDDGELIGKDSHISI